MLGNYPKLHILILFILIFNWCCKHDSNNLVGWSGEFIIPYAIGNEWTYNVTHYDRNGTVLETWSENRKVVRDTLIQNVKWFIIRNQGYGYVAESIEQNIDHARYIWNSPKGERLRIMIYPPSDSGKYYQWMVSQANGKDTIIYYPIYISKSVEEINTPAGNFLCYTYTNPGFSFSWPTGVAKSSAGIFYLSNIGIVKSVSYYDYVDDGKISIVSELSKVILK